MVYKFPVKSGNVKSDFQFRPGFGNYKFFLQFLFYAYIYVIFLIALLYKPISKLWSGNLVPNGERKMKTT